MDSIDKISPVEEMCHVTYKVRLHILASRGKPRRMKSGLECVLLSKGVWVALALRYWRCICSFRRAFTGVRL
jgi:hypothetical protein